jgi:cobalamin biosynthesis Mg chelatase CobN
MKLFRLSFVSIVTVFLFGSCTMQKRQYMPGYHVQWNESNPKVKSEKNERAEESVITENGIVNEENFETQVAFLETTENITVSSSKKNIQTGQTEVEKVTSAIRHGKKLETKSTASTKVQKTKASKSLSMGLIGGLLLIIVALLLLGLGLIFSNILGVVGIVFLLIFLIAAVMLLIAGLVKMFSGGN